MTRDMISETFARLFTVLVICLMIGSGMVAITFPFGAGAAPEGGFELNENVTANLTTIAPAVVNEGDTFIGMINISFRNTGGINDTLEWINVQVKNYTNVVTVSIWNETNDDSTFSTLSDTLMGVVAPSPLAGDIGYANFTGLNMGIMNNTNMSVYVAFNISSTATHADQINASVMMNNVFMTFAGQGGNRSLYPSYDTRIDNINVTASLTTVAPGVVNAGDNNVGMINIPLF